MDWPSVAPFLALLAVLLLADSLFYRFASLATKRRFHVAWQVGSFVVFLASLTLLKENLYSPRLIVSAALLFTFLDLARIRFCGTCGATVRSWRRKPCPKCASRSAA